jgi:hypothetical protein
MESALTSGDRSADGADTLQLGAGNLIWNKAMGLLIV